MGENIRFGQVNAVLVTLCLLDLLKGADGVRVGRFTLRWPRGALVGVAVAIKLTPGVFLVHFALTRQWRELRNAVLAAVGVTVATFLVAPAGSLEFWTSALLDSDRLGPNAGSSNQSLRGFVLRLYLSDGATSGAVGGAGAGGGGGGVRAGAGAAPARFAVGEVAACGMVAVLVSPVSWLHHLLWGVVVLGAVVGDGRVRRRVVAAVVGLLLLWVAWPWWGANLLAARSVPVVLARVVQNGDLWWACLSLPVMWRLVAVSDGAAGRSGRDTPRINHS